MSPTAARLLGLTRATHTYASLLALVAIGMFAVSGLILNHGEWFGADSGRTSSVQGRLPTDLLEQADQAAVVDRLRTQFKLSGKLDSFDVDDSQLIVTFHRPGWRAQATIDRADGAIEVQSENRGLIGALADLHRGVAAAGWWRVMIDIVAALLILVVLTGVVIWLSLPRRRARGVAMLLLGAAAWLAAYLLLVVV